MTVTTVQGVPEPTTSSPAPSPARASKADDFVATIVCNGQRYTNWKSVMVRRDFGDWCSVFQFTAAEQSGVGQGWANLRLKPGDAVQILLGGIKIIDGTVTTRVTAFDDRSHDLVIAGKSLTQDMHSSVVVKPGSLNGYTLEQATRGALAPQGIGLVIKNPSAIMSKPFRSLNVQIGETIGEFVERMARMRGMNLTDDENGNLVLAQVDPNAPVVAELQEGVNILRGQCKLDNQAEWSGLTVPGQYPDADADAPPRDHSATVTNPNATTTRTQIMVAEHTGDAEDHQQRADHESARMAWQTVDCSITVVGWKKADGTLWIPTEKVTVKSPSMFPNDTGSLPLGIQACTYMQDSQNGTTTTLDLRLPGALTQTPNPFTGSTPESNDPIQNARPEAAKVDTPDTS